MSVVVLDWLGESATASFKAGVCRTLTRAIMLAMPAEENQTADALISAAMADPKMPQAGDEIVVAGSTLVLRTHDHTTNSGRVTVSLGYENLTGGGTTPDGVTYPARGGTSLEAADTNIDPTKPVDPVTGKPVAIVLSHGGVEQTGSISVTYSRPFIAFDVPETTTKPGDITKEWANTVNKAPWQGGEIGEWKCTDCAFEPLDLTGDTPVWLVRYEFQWKKGGHQPAAVFIDKETNAPVHPLDDDNHRVIEVYELLDFSTKFPAG